MSQFIKTEQDEHVAIVTIDNGPMNPLSTALLAELLAEVERLDHDPDARAVILQGGGDRAFVAGADIKEFPAWRDSEGNGNGPAAGIHAVTERMEGARTPFIAAIQGFCLGGGLEIAMGCDIRVASEDAQFGQPEIKLGIIPGGGGTQRLPRLIGSGRAMLMNLTGDFFDARTVEAWGLVERVVPREQVLEAAVELARTIAARSPFAAGVLKEVIRETRDVPLEEGTRKELAAVLRCLRSEDGREGVAAFLEKRQPVFTGR